MSPFSQLWSAARFGLGLQRQRLDTCQAARLHGDLLSRRRMPSGSRDPYPVHELMRERGPILPTRMGPGAQAALGDDPRPASPAGRGEPRSGSR